MRFALCIGEFDVPKETLEPLLRLARESGASVEILHVLPVSTSTGEAWSGSREQVDSRVAEEVKQARAKAESALAHITAASDTPIKITIIPAGASVSQSIVDHCESQQFDLIALASHTPREGEGEPRIGSIASDVVTGTTTPVCLLYPVAKRTDTVDPAALAEGSFVFTSDGDELGVVTEVRAESFTVKGDVDGESRKWSIPQEAVAGAVSGRTELTLTRAAVDEHATSASNPSRR